MLSRRITNWIQYYIIFLIFICRHSLCDYNNTDEVNNNELINSNSFTENVAISSMLNYAKSNDSLSIDNEANFVEIVRSELNELKSDFDSNITTDQNGSIKDEQHETIDNLQPQLSNANETIWELMKLQIQQDFAPLILIIKFLIPLNIRHAISVKIMKQVLFFRDVLIGITSPLLSTSGRILKFIGEHLVVTGKFLSDIGSIKDSIDLQKVNQQVSIVVDGSEEIDNVNLVISPPDVTDIINEDTIVENSLELTGNEIDDTEEILESSSYETNESNESIDVVLENNNHTTNDPDSEIIDLDLSS